MESGCCEVPFPGGSQPRHGSPAIESGPLQFAVGPMHRRLRAIGSLAAVPRITESFRTGRGMGWHEHDDGVFHGCEKFFRPGYAANFVPSWIPALDGVPAKLEVGARVADVGCGKGASTILMAKAFPKSQFFGFDYHDKSIDGARETARHAGISDRVVFETATSKNFPGKDYDLVTVFDCLHDMGDPVGAAAHVRSALANDGKWMIVEPYANDELKDNLNPGFTILFPRCSAPLAPAHRRLGCAWAHRQAKSGSAKLFSRRASPGSAAPPRLRSTSSTRRGPESKTG